MIGKLSGFVDGSGTDWVRVDVSGVGYVVFASSRTLSRLPAMGEAVSLLVETHVREDHIHLYGFIDQAELDWFRLLGTVQGVGAKMALAILSALPPEQLVQAIAAQDKSALTRASGVGPKLAGRIAAELRDKVDTLAMGLGPVARGGDPGVPAVGVSEDAVSALVNLGYRRIEAFGAISRASGELGQGASLESLIKLGLKELGA